MKARKPGLAPHPSRIEQIRLRPPGTKKPIADAVSQALGGEKTPPKPLAPTYHERSIRGREHRHAQLSESKEVDRSKVGRAQLRPMNVDDDVATVYAGSPLISPDGRLAFYTQPQLDLKENDRISNHFVVPVEGGNPIRVGLQDTRADASDFSFSPDGKYLAFIAREGGRGPAQLWIQPSTGGEAVRVTDPSVRVRRSLPDGAIGDPVWYRWSPSGDRLFFIADRASSRAEKNALRNSDGAFFADEGPNGQIPDRWSAVFEVTLGDPPPKPSAPAKRPARGRKERESTVAPAIRQITKGDHLIFDLAVSPDGQRLAVVHRTDNRISESRNAEVAVVDVKTGQLTDVTKNSAPEKKIKWHPNGRELTFLAPDDQNWELKEPRIWAVDIATKKTRCLSHDFEGHIVDYDWAPGGRLLVHAGVRTNRGLYAIDGESGAVSPLFDRPGEVESVSFSADGQRAVMVFSDAVTPPQVYAVRLDGSGETTQLSRLNRHLEAVKRAKLEIIRWKSKDGQEVEGLLFVPADWKPSKGPLPTILQLHGGPRDASTNRWTGDSHLLAAEGYATLWPNVRGSTGYGDAWLQGNKFDIGGGDLQDALTGIDHLIERGIADKDRLGVRGWSYGGVLGGFAITQTDRFKAASLGAMVSDWASQYTAGFNHDMQHWYIGGTPWDNGDAYRQRSALTHVKNVKTPTILFHGENDYVDAPSQSRSFFSALTDLGVPARLLLFEGEGHTIRRPKHRQARLTSELAWLAAHVLGRRYVSRSKL